MPILISLIFLFLHPSSHMHHKIHTHSLLLPLFMSTFYSYLHAYFIFCCNDKRCKPTITVIKRLSHQVAVKIIMVKEHYRLDLATNNSRMNAADLH